MDILIESVSSAGALSVVAFALLVLQRTHGLVVLELFPASLAAGLITFSAAQSNRSPALLTSGDLLLPLAANLIIIAVAARFYQQWRHRVAGESTVLMISFCSMNFVLEAMRTFSEGHSASVGLAQSFPHGKLGLETSVLAVSTAILISTTVLLKSRGTWAAAQLANRDWRLLLSFGHSAEAARRIILLLAVSLMAVGTVLYISLQESFAIQHSSAILIPAFALSLFQNRIKLPIFLGVAFVALLSEHFLSLWTNEVMRDFS